ncbi:MAG: Ger(x)C family spore germination protein [Clostridia bacterium]|nr:Ger(x)C family spore germination protein [Clostridia bacterium]
MRIKILFLLPFLLILSGCYDYRETDSMAIVSGLHVAKGTEQRYKLTFEIVGTKADDRSMKAQITGMEGDTVAQAIDNATAVSGKKLYFGHAQVLAIDYELAKEGIGDILDYFSRQNDMRLTMNVIISEGMSGEELFKSEEGDIRSFVLADMLKANEERAITPNIELYSFIADSFERGKDSCLPIVNMEENGNINLSSLAVFKKARLVGNLNEDDTKYLMLLENIGERGGFILEREGGSPVSFEIRSRKVDIKPRLENGKILCDIDLKAQFGVLELTGDDSVIVRHKLEEMENELGKYVYYELGQFVDNLRQTDLLGIERQLIRHNPQLEDFLAESFPKLYEKARFNISLDLDIIDSGRTLRKLGKS